MSHPQEFRQTRQPEDAPAALREARIHAGALLHEAREAAGRSAAELATQLKVSPDKIVALEEGNWDALPDAAFARGLLRASAKALRIDADALVRGLPATPGAPLAGVPRTAPARAGGGAGGRLWWIALAVLVIAALMVLLPRARDAQRARQDVRPAAAPVSPSPGAMRKAAASAAAVVPASVPVSRASAAASAPAPSPARPGASAAGTPLVLRATADSWFEVRAAGGQVLASGTLHAGDHQEVPLAASDRPARVTIGNTAVTRVEFGAQPIDLGVGTHGNVAHVVVP